MKKVKIGHPGCFRLGPSILGLMFGLESFTNPQSNQRLLASSRRLSLAMERDHFLDRAAESGQKRDTVFVFNMRYRDSIEERVHQMLSSRLKHIHDLFGQIPDTLVAAWIAAALGDERKARETIDAVPEKHPFEAKYNQIARINWESCAEVLNRTAARESLERAW
jgi:hypothetical protein